MKKRAILLLLLGLIIVGKLNSQCREIKYKISPKKYYSLKDSIVFIAENYCKNNKFILYSLEHRDSVDWQEIDNDIFSPEAKAMKIIKLTPIRSRRFCFKINTIDSIYREQSKISKFRIIENLYSNNKIEIIQTKVVKEFFIEYNR